MSIDGDAPGAPAPVTRDELVAMVAKAHHGGAYAESTLAGRTLADHSRLPRPIAENLGAALGQWDFFPEPAEIVEFACAYEPPATEEALWALARTWASDDAAGRPTVLALVGREILQRELRRIPIPALKEVVDEPSAARARTLREAAGLAVPAAPAAGGAKRKSPAAAKRAPRAAGPAAAIPTRMPKPKFVPPPPKAPPPPARRFSHPKFGEGALEREEGAGEETKLTIRFESGSKTLLARFVTEVTEPDPTA